MTKYRTSNWDARIEQVEVEKETASCVWIKGRKRAKATDYHFYFDTFDQAKQKMIEIAQAKVDGLQRQLDNAKGFLGNCKGIKTATIPDPRFV